MNSRTIVGSIAAFSLVVLVTALLITRADTQRALAKQADRIATLEKRIQASESELSYIKSRVEPLEAEVRQTQMDLSTHLFSSFVKDVAGNTPDSVVNAYLKAQQNQDWSAVYNCLTGAPISAAEFVEEMKRSTQSIVQYTLGGYQLRDPEHARVFVSLVVRYEGSDKEMKIETEPWAVLKDHGQWKVRWLARQ